MKHLFPYKQTKNKAFFKDGNKELVVTRKGDNIELKGDKINKILDWDIGETVHADKFKLSYKK